MKVVISFGKALRKGASFDSKRPSLRARVATSEVPVDQSTAWSDFSRAVSGEWEGSTCTFSWTGAALELPPLYVPQAFRDWEIQLFDWQTQTSSTVKDGNLKVSVKKLMPTVGCEADAVAFNEEAADVFAGDFPRAFLADGSYTRAPRLRATEEFKLEHVMCEGQGETRTRIRLVQSISASNELRLADLGSEEWSEPYNGGRELFACGGGSNKISKVARLEAAQMEGKSWKAVEGRSASFEASGASTSAPAALSALPQSGTLAGLEGLLLLPSGVYSFVTKQADGHLSLEAGWLLEGGKQRRVSRAVYSADGKQLVAVHMGVEEAA